MNRVLIFVVVLIAVGFHSCSVKKFIPEGEQLYTGGEVDMEADFRVPDKKAIESELNALLKPEPNSKILGMRIGLWAHYKGSQENPGFINRFLKNKFGEEPVYFSSVDPERTENLIFNRLENRGFFYSTVASEVTRKEKYASVQYSAALAEPYVLENYQVDGDSLPIEKKIAELLEETELKPGMRFDLNLLKDERVRLDEALKLEGYYNITPDLLIFEADTNSYEDKKFDLFVRAKLTAPEKSLIPYVIKDINVFPNFSLSGQRREQDTVEVSNIKFMQDELVFKPELLEQYILFQPGQLYSSQTSRRTSSRLTSIGSYRYVNIRFDEEDSTRTEDGEGQLQANIFLSPLNKRTVRAELMGRSKSNNFAGPGVSLTFRNRNLFAGGETFNFSTNFSYETQLAGGDRKGLSSFELGIRGDLIFPRVVFPFPIKERFSYSVPKTKISLGAELMNRVGLYRLNSISASYGYNWNANRYVYHEINPINLSYVNLSKTTPEFDAILESNPFLKRSFEQQFIAGINYLFNYNQLGDPERKHAIFVGTTLDLAGNLVNLVNRTFGGENTIFGLEYAQYAKADVEFRYHLKLRRDSEDHVIATRVFGGWGQPYGNSLSLPYVKQYFAGGPNSVRAFRIRSLGPGTFRPEEFNIGSFFDQSGDIRLEGNIEYRFPIVSIVKGAVFADAGNIWLAKENEAIPGGKFNKNWYKELGVGAGLGLRVDIQFFVIRLDLATPLRSPHLPENERWGNDFDFKNKTWRRENLVFNFAIGYPF
ncbi:MAG TPA: BamA/TamA family outer membrane protein [Cyclobacteriaceae bacterium]|nr:BamA/TamA family outer membrane protein [Cyclobacteriaceae bacterium]